MIRKVGLFFLSLWLLFILIIVITIDVPLCFSGQWKFIGFSELLYRNRIPLVCLFALIIGVISLRDFKFQTRGTAQLSFKITEVESIEYEHLTFLTTYIIPLVCFQFDSTRYIVAFVIILVVIGKIYIRTDLFYANPTLAILNFRIYKVSGEFRDGTTRKERIIITKDIINQEDRVKYFKLDERIYYASLTSTNEQD